MIKVLTATALFICSLLAAQGQYEQGMGKAFQLWGEGKNTEAAALFERIAAVEKNNWLPNYYVALVNTTTAFRTKGKDEVTALLTKAQNALDVELIKNENNPELLVMQAMIHTAWIAYNPMTNGQKLSGKVMELYGKAQAIAPENPRVVFCKAEFEIGGAKFWGTDTTPMCAQMIKLSDFLLLLNQKQLSHQNGGWTVLKKLKKIVKNSSNPFRVLTLKG